MADTPTTQVSSFFEPPPVNIPRDRGSLHPVQVCSPVNDSSDIQSMPEMRLAIVDDAGGISTRFDTLCQHHRLVERCSFYSKLIFSFSANTFNTYFYRNFSIYFSAIIIKLRRYQCICATCAFIDEYNIFFFFLAYCILVQT